MWQKLLEALATPWAVVGFIGQLFFGARFFVQWIHSERRGESSIPLSFWYLSVVGSLVLLAYAIQRADPVFIAGLALNSVIYIRNLMLIYKKKAQQVT